MQKGDWVDGFSPRHAQENEFITMDGWFGNLDKVVALELSAFLAEEAKIQMLLILIPILHASYPYYPLETHLILRIMSKSKFAIDCSSTLTVCRLS